MGVWTDKKIEQLKELWKEGIPTAEIGKRLDFSKNAIVGKVNRLGLEHRTSPIKSSSKSTKVQEAVNVADEVKNQSVGVSLDSKVSVKKLTDMENSGKVTTSASKNASEMDGVRLLDLTSDRCCWPIDDGASGCFHFCGKKVFKGKPYCLEHCAMAYTSSSAQREKNKSES